MSLNSNIPADQTQNNTEPIFVNEEEAKEIDSCLNFLSILDDETSNDSCNFTLFRKKDNSIIDASKTDKEKIPNEEENIQEKDLDCIVVSPSFKSSVNNDLIGNVVSPPKCSDSFKKIITDGSSGLNLPKSTRSQNIKISPKIFKISNTSNKSVLMPPSKNETSSVIRMKDNIILKVTRSPVKQNSIPVVANAKIICSPNLATAKETLASKELNKIASCSDIPSQLNQNINVEQKLYSKTNNITTKECASLSLTDDSMKNKGDNFLKRLEGISACRNNISTTVGNKDIKTFDYNINEGSKNILNSIKVLTVKQVPNQLKGNEVSCTSVSPTIEKKSTKTGINSSTHLIKNDAENRCNDLAVNNSEISLDNDDSLDFVPLNPYSAVEIIKKSSNEKKKAENEVDKKTKAKKVSCKLLPGKNKNKNGKLIKFESKKKSKKLSKNCKVYAPLVRAGLPTFMKQSDDESQSSFKSLSEEIQSKANISTKISVQNTPDILISGPNLFQHDTNIEFCASKNVDLCQDKDLDANAFQMENDVFEMNNKQLFKSLEWLDKKKDNSSLSLDNSLVSNEETLSCVSESTASCISESTNLSDIIEVSQITNEPQKMIEENSTATDVTSNPKIDANEVKDTSNEPTPPFVYSFNKNSSLSFTVQNILENMFRYECFPTSTNMARLAKIVGVQWREIRDWFVGRRSLSKKNGMYMRNQPLTSCFYCPDFSCCEEDKAIVHLLSADHIRSMMKSMEKYNTIFTEVQNKKNDSKDSETNTENNTEETKIKKIKSVKAQVKTNIKPNVDVDDNLSLATKSSRIEKLDVFKTPKIPTEKLRSSLKRKKNIDSTVFIGFRCPVCLKIFNTEWMLIRHSLTHRKLICSECKEVFLREDLLRNHLLQHIIESMDDDLYPVYICRKCSNLNCECKEGMNCAPSLNCKLYSRPQTARRSKPFRSAPYSGVNDHLKVSMDEFWQKYRTRKQNPFKKAGKFSLPLNSHQSKLGSKPNLTKQDKKSSQKITPSPTYTNFTTFNCKICETFFYTRDELEEHMTVHRIQARNRNKKRENDEDVQESKRAKYSVSRASPLPIDIFICSYCDKSFKTKNFLFKHVRLTCNAILYTLKATLNNNTSLFHLERINTSNKYKIRIVDNVPPASKTPLKSAKVQCLCSLEFSPDKLEAHKRVCFTEKSDKQLKKQVYSETDTEKSNNRICAKEKSDNLLCIKEKSDNHQPDKTMKFDNSKSNNNSSISNKDNSELYYFLCKYCDTPLDSPKTLLLHVKGSCKQTPNEVLSELEAQRLSAIEIAVDKHYKRIERKNLLNVLPLPKIQSLLEENSFKNVHNNYKRVKCKFCDKIPLKTCLKLHLLKQCKHIPEKLQNLLEVYGKYFINSQKKLKTLPSLNEIGDKELSSRDSFEEETSESQDVVHIVGNIKMEHELLYDCHLCEEKFKISKDFITHMQDFHCMTISEEAACKWLSNLEEDDTEEIPAKNSDNAEDSPTKNMFHEQSPSKSEPSEDEDEIKIITYDTLSSELTNDTLLEDDTISSELIDDTLLGDYSIPLEEVNETSSSKSEKWTSPLNTPSKSRKLDDELFNDFTNLDNFIETVQLEDQNFSTS